MPPDPQKSLLPQTYHFCTYFDKHYLTRGLALYQSLREHCQRPFVFWVLCFDQTSYSILDRLALDGIRLIRREDFEAGDDALATARANRSVVEYYWTCTPSLPLFILRQDVTIELITYMDADLFFYSDPQPIFDELAEGSVLIHEHRYQREYAQAAETSGHYNVGLMVFRRDDAAMECLHWWRDRCIEWCYARFESGKFGDQKYLDDWPERFRRVVVLQHPGAGLAPWNIGQYRLNLAGNKRFVDGYPLVFFHFHAFRVLTQTCIAPSEGYVYPISVIDSLFRPYIEALERNADYTPLPFADTFVESTWWSRVKGCLFAEALMLQPKSIGRFLWEFGVKNHLARIIIYESTSAYEKNTKRPITLTLLRALSTSPFIVLSRPFRTLLYRYIRIAMR